MNRDHISLWNFSGEDEVDDADDDEEEDDGEDDEGTHHRLLIQVPFVRDNIEGIWLRDTTSIIHHLEAKYPDKVEIAMIIRQKHFLSKVYHLNSFCQALSTLTGDPVADFFSLLLEDWADEYLWRPAMYYR